MGDKINNSILSLYINTCRYPLLLIVLILWYLMTFGRRNVDSSERSFFCAPPKKDCSTICNLGICCCTHHPSAHLISSLFFLFLWSFIFDLVTFLFSPVDHFIFDQLISWYLVRSKKNMTSHLSYHNLSLIFCSHILFSQMFLLFISWYPPFCLWLILSIF